MHWMQAEHNFKASKAQYERQFKTWNFRKNLKDPEQHWKSAHYRIEKRKRCGKDSDLYIDGVLIRKKKVAKETSRHNFPTIQELYGQARSPETPGGIYISTPPAIQVYSCLLDYLPWFQFQTLIKSTVRPSSDLANVANSLVLFSSSMDLLREYNNISSPPIDRDITSILATWATETTITSRSRAIRQIHSLLRTIVPEEVDRHACAESIPKLTKLGGTESQFFCLAVYLISNNMFQSTDLAKMIDLFENPRNIPILERILSVQTSTVQALTEILLPAAIRSEKIGVVTLIVKLRSVSNISVGGSGYIQRAVETGNIKLAKLLVNAGADVDARNITDYARNRTALQVAAARGSLELVQILLDAGADINAPAAGHGGRAALQAAAEEVSLELVQVLLDAGADVEARNVTGYVRNSTTLQLAATRGSLELVQILLNAGADINAPADDHLGRTALQAAAEEGSLELVRVLFDAGADISAPAASCGGRTALQAAAEKGDLELVQILLNAGAEVNAAPSYSCGATALQLSAIKGYFGIAMALLNTGADVNAPAGLISGRTALEGAAEFGRIDMVHLLLDAGAGGIKKSSSEIGFKAWTPCRRSAYYIPSEVMKL